MSDLAKTVEDLGRAFNAFKAANDQRLAAIETQGAADPLLENKVQQANDDVTRLSDDLQQQRAALEARVDSIEAAANRGAFGGGGGGDVALAAARAEHGQAFDAYFRKGVDDGLRDLEINAALTTQSDPDGGFVVPEEVDTEIDRVLGTVSAMRSLATVRAVGSATYQRIVNVGGTSSGWVGETQTPTETNTPTLKAQNYPTMELYAEPHATNSMLEDASFGVESWLAGEVSIEFAEQEGAAYVAGDGVGKPRGLLSYNTVANASVTYGNVGYIAAGAAGGFAASNPSDKLIDLVHALKAGYRTGAVWLMNDLTLAEVRKFKDSTGNYLWTPGLTAGQKDVLLGYPVGVDDNMPDISANSLSIGFGNWKQGYIITDRRGTQVLRDPYTAKPYVKFYTTKRVGGGIRKFEAVKLMKFATS